MTDMPTGAVDAVEASLRNFLSRWGGITVHGTDLDSQLRGAAMIAVRETLAHNASQCRAEAPESGVHRGTHICRIVKAHDKHRCAVCSFSWPGATAQR